jgi:transcriptional regulator with XRE-family HTH domain
VSYSITDVQTNLRKIRKSKGLSLRQVEILSNGKYKPITIGSYERGTRAISVNRLIELSEFYDVPITEFFWSSNHAPSSTQIDELINIINSLRN